MIDQEKNQTHQQEQDVDTPIEHGDGVQKVDSQAGEENSYKELYVRLNADFQNFKRRVDKERIEWMHTAQGNMLARLLPIFDELDRVLDLAEQQASPEVQTWLEGLKLVQKNWQKEFTNIGISEIPTTGMFDPALHEALMYEAVSGKESGEIVKVFSKGYKLKDKVIQHAKVSVAQ